MEIIKRITPIVIGVFVLLSTSPYAQQSDRLEDIQQQIKQRQKEIDAKLAKAKKLESQLKKFEIEIGKTAKALNQTQINLENNQLQRKQLLTQQSDLQKKQSQQQTILAKQLRSAYMAGNYDYAKMLFNQDDAGKFERVLSYYKYLNGARQQQIEQFRELVAELIEVNKLLADKQQQLLELQSEQQKQRQTLAKQQDSRKATLTAIEQSINSDAEKVEQLQINEQSILKAIQEAQRLANLKPTTLNGLAKLKGQLLKPAKGRLRRLFGNRRQGQVRWKGVLINGNSGSPVRSIHDGKVLYADYLRGLGLVTVIDHGEGYMSLYGHNQALLKQAGETVEAGETIALVGQSGGQSSPNLYFEIRHKGKAINPSNWLKR